MALTVKQMSLTVAFFGVLSFVFGVIAENKKVLLPLVIRKFGTTYFTNFILYIYIRFRGLK